MGSERRRRWQGLHLGLAHCCCWRTWASSAGGDFQHDVAALGPLQRQPAWLPGALARLAALAKAPPDCVCLEPAHHSPLDADVSAPSSLLLLTSPGTLLVPLVRPQLAVPLWLSQPLQSCCIRYYPVLLENSLTCGSSLRSRKTTVSMCHGGPALLSCEAPLTAPLLQ